VSRAARTGDNVSMDRRITQGDETLQAVEDELYEIGSRQGHPEVDDNLRGAKAGDILRFDITDPEAGGATFHILVKEVKEKLLPEVTDEWASEASEFETVAELRENVREQLRGVRKVEAAFTMRGKVIEALVELVDEEMPDTLVADEMQRRLGVLVNRITEQGADFKRWLEATGRSQEDLFTELRAEAIAGAKADLALRAVADLEDIQVSDEELAAEVGAMAGRQDRSVEEVQAELDDEGKLPLVRSGLRKSKALEWLIGHIEFVDEDGHVIDRSELVFDDETERVEPEILLNQDEDELDQDDEAAQETPE
jgi:trigger factor